MNPEPVCVCEGKPKRVSQEVTVWELSVVLKLTPAFITPYYRIMCLRVMYYTYINTSISHCGSTDLIRIQAEKNLCPLP